MTTAKCCGLLVPRHLMTEQIWPQIQWLSHVLADTRAQFTRNGKDMWEDRGNFSFIQ
jgi:hypothetical protein